MIDPESVAARLGRIEKNDLNPATTGQTSVNGGPTNALRKGPEMRSCHHRRSCAFSGGSRSSPCSARRPMTLAGWKLTPPVAGRKGDVATLDPAAVAPPWLVADGGG